MTTAKPKRHGGFILLCLLVLMPLLSATAAPTVSAQDASSVVERADVSPMTIDPPPWCSYQTQQPHKSKYTNRPRAHGSTDCNGDSRVSGVWAQTSLFYYDEYVGASYNTGGVSLHP